MATFHSARHCSGFIDVSNNLGAERLNGTVIPVYRNRLETNSFHSQVFYVNRNTHTINLRQETDRKIPFHSEIPTLDVPISPNLH